MKKLIVFLLITLSLMGCQSFSEGTLYRELSKSVFKISIPTPIGISMGTASVVATKHGNVGLSAAHVCATSSDGIVIASKFDSIQNLKLRIIAIDRDKDLCMIEAPSGMPALQVLKGPMEEYEELYSEGYPMNTVLTPRSGHLIAVLTDPLALFGSIGQILEETSILGFPGQSGSPIVDRDNKLVGILIEADRDLEITNMVPRKAISVFLDAN